MLGLLLEGVQHIDGAGEPDGVDGSIGVTIEVVDDLQHAGAAESPERLGEGCLEAELRIPERTADSPPDFLREALQILSATPNSAHRLGLDVVLGGHDQLGASSLRASYACSGIVSRLGGTRRRVAGAFSLRCVPQWFPRWDITIVSTRN